MSQKPKNPFQFWEELKRRRVIRVITVYAAASFVILELTDIITEPFGLPDWTLKLVFVILAVGLVVSVILSWIYDIQPEGGIVKTEPVHKVKAENIPKSSNSWKIANYISFVVIVGLIVLNIIPRINSKAAFADLETSIAVLPFENMSDDTSYSYIGGAFTDEIIMEMQKIKAFDRVLSRTSTMQYGENRPTIPEIAEKLNVNYIIEGSIQRMEKRVRVRVQVIRARNENHIWGDSYDEDYLEPEDILNIQSRIAQSVADELKVIITPEEMELIERIPTTSLSAFEFYRIGREDYLRNWVDNRDNLALERAEELFLNALELDSTFALAYVGLARLYWAKQGFRNYLSEDYLDSILILCDLALSYDNQLAEAYTIKGFYFGENGDSEQARIEFDKAIKYNPNDWETYRWKGFYASGDQVDYIKNYHKAVSLNHGSELPSLLRNLAAAYANAGFIEQYHFYNNEAFKLDHDSISYYFGLAFAEANLGNFNRSAELLIRAYELDTSRIRILSQIGLRYMYAGKYEEMLQYFKKFNARAEASGLVNLENMHRLGFAYAMNGYRAEADHCFDTTIEYYEKLTMQEREPAGTYYDLACVYAFRGVKDQAYKNLRFFNQRERFPRWWVELFERDPLFDSIRDEPEFQQIVLDVEAKYQAEHERVRKWLEENDML